MIGTMSYASENALPTTDCTQVLSTIDEKNDRLSQTEKFRPKLKNSNISSNKTIQKKISARLTKIE